MTQLHRWAGQARDQSQLTGWLTGLTSLVWKQTASKAARAMWCLVVNWLRPQMILRRRKKRWDGEGRGGGGAGHFISRTLLALRRKTKASQIYIKELNQALQYKQTINWMYNRNVTDTWASFWTMWLYRWWRPAKSLLWNNCEFCIM